jgi:hypothetical protein
MDNKNQISTVGAYEADLQRLNNVTFALGLNQPQLVHILVVELENLLSDSIKHNAMIGVQSFRYKLVTKRSGLTLTIGTIPQAQVLERKSEPITAKFDNQGNFKGLVEK